MGTHRRPPKMSTLRLLERFVSLDSTAAAAHLNPSATRQHDHPGYGASDGATARRAAHMARSPIDLRASLGRIVRSRFAAPLLVAFTFSFGGPALGDHLPLDQTKAVASPLASDLTQRGGPPAGVPPGPPDGVPNGPPDGLPPAGLPFVLPSATPELGSITLFGAGVAGIAGYVLTRARARRRRT